MEAVTIASHFSPATGIRLSSTAICRASAPKRTLRFSPSTKSSLSTTFISPFVGSSLFSDLSGQRIRPDSLYPSSSTGFIPKRAVVTMVIPFGGDPSQDHPPDLASYLFKNRIVYLGMSLVPSVTELILAEFLYLQYEDEDKPIYFYINSTGTTKGGEKLGYETEAFAVYDVMSYVKPPIFTLCVGNAWGEAALLLAAGSKGNRAALPSSTIMIKQPISQFQGQATDVEIMRKEVNNVKAELVKLYSENTGKSPEEIEEDIKRPKYFSPSEAVEYGIIDKVIYNERGNKDRGVVSDLKKAQLI
ncbi:ATP-dependent Clp protease proteolytic subunit-related protein 4, chloroplastic [Solanum pennellii]|uniref:ATP-dependent Clp protease proteolytic subunit n=1 Tax=Solanum pennellii TaxID=28526 RepID=A0ABM1HGC5_SOLPN|nr:ATP-dependent Clp protease proteolytic subunit-related protein 4, chloroplastic [Solanum pennellii]XP_027774813.1 ATP-dependent Clp protease proteolytic subunit-related protein 4, chloroplastic [Solanum pennellii]